MCLGMFFSKGVPSYIPKKRTVFDTVCIDHFIGSSNVLCKSCSIVQCSETGHAQAADDHIPIAGFFQLPIIDSTAPIPRKKIRYDRAALGDEIKARSFINLLNNLPIVRLELTTLLMAISFSITFTVPCVKLFC